MIPSVDEGEESDRNNHNRILLDGLDTHHRHMPCPESSL
jgi:hypothetical protein